MHRSVRILVFILVGVLCVTVTAQYNKCSSNQQCTEFNSCAEFKSYVGKPASGWPKSVQDQVRTRLCKMETRGRNKIYFVCCGKSGKDLLNAPNCGKHSDDRIAFGQQARVFAYPWMALLLDDYDKVQCGGTLITENFVLTAAHCDRKFITTIRLGENDISKPIDCNYQGAEEDCADPVQDIPLDRFIRHPLYSTAKKRNDIALVKLAYPAQISDSVKTVCLPIGRMVRNPLPTEMIVTGWGYTETGVLSNVLRYARIPIVANNECTRIYSRLSDAIELDDESQFCAGGRDKKDNCRGDSGGPLQYQSLQSEFVQYGVVAFGLKSCGTESVPGVYTKVSNYIDWIVQNVQ